MYVRTRTHAHIHIHTYTYTHTHIHTYTYTHTHTREEAKIKCVSLSFVKNNLPRRTQIGQRDTGCRNTKFIYIVRKK